MRLPRSFSRPNLSRWILALACAAGPVGAHGQDTLKIPSTTTTAQPAGTVLSRPPVTVTRPPATTTTTATQQQTVRVPDVSGRTVEEARRILAASGLEVGRVVDGTGTTGTPGTVMQQQPRAGAGVEPKSAVQLWLVPARQRPAITVRPPVTQQPAAVTVPRVVGRTTGDARTVLARAGLQVGAVTEVTGGTPGTVVRQLPAAGSTAEPASAVRLWVVPARVATQPGENLVRVPDLAGRNRTDAQVALAAAGLRPAGFETGGTGTPGTVARQQPAAGTSVARGSGVRLWLVPARVAATDPPAQNPPAQNPPAQNPPAQNPPVQAPVAQDTPARNPAVDSAAPYADSLIVPDVRRLALADARLSLQAAGLAAAFDVAFLDSATWMVRAQQPAPGSRLAAGGVVALLLDPPSPAAVAGTAGANPPPAGGNGFQAPSTPPSDATPWFTRWPLWIAVAVVLLLLAAVAAARWMRGRARPLPVAAVRAQVRMDVPARVAVEGAPFAAGELRFRMTPGRAAARVSPGGSLFVQKEISVDG